MITSIVTCAKKYECIVITILLLSCHHHCHCVSDLSWALPCRLAKERSAEDHLFGDKEKFVTAAYKKKLEEEKQWLAEEKVR